MAKTTEKYEVLYVLNPNLTEEETQAIVEKFKTLIEQNGTVDEMEEWGKRKLAYEINYLKRSALVAVLVLVVALLDTSANSDHRSSVEVAGDELCSLSPGDNVDEIGLLFTVFTAAEIPVNSNGKGRHGNVGAGIAQLRVPRQAAHKNDMIQHIIPSAYS